MEPLGGEYILLDSIIYVKDKSGNSYSLVMEAVVGRRGVGPGGGAREGLRLLSRSVSPPGGWSYQHAQFVKIRAVPLRNFLCVCHSSTDFKKSIS